MEGYTLVKKVWGYERQIANFKQEGYCGKILTVIPGFQCSVHFHAVKHETFFVLRGELYVELYDIPKDCRMAAVANPAGVKDRMLRHPYAKWLKEHEKLTIAPFQAHRFWCGGNKHGEIAEFIEFSTYDDEADSYRVVPSRPVPSSGPAS